MPTAGSISGHVLQLEPPRRTAKSTEAWALQSFENCDNWNLAAGAEENAQFKKLVADLSLDKQMLQDVIKKKL